MILNLYYIGFIRVWVHYLITMIRDYHHYVRLLEENFCLIC